ncbi:MAG: family hydrolase [Herbinix sp.]|jgi:HAD superfamily hydrolase (TIGR01549 family)|nr:family hydrolase [Herbinix sp.]
MSYKAMIFDIDGTLLDTEQAVLTSLQHTLYRSTGHLYSFEELHFALGIPGYDALQRLNITDIGRVLSLWDYYYSQYSCTTKVFENVSELLDALKESNILLGIVTSKTREEYHRDFLPYSISNYFTYSICADDTTLHKPNPEPLLAMVKQLQVAPNEVLYVGDTKYDMECAEKAGVYSALATWGCKHPESIKCNWKLTNPNDLLFIN